MHELIRLRTLDLTGCSQLAFSQMEAIADSLHMLLPESGGSLTGLQELKLSGCSRLRRLPVPVDGLSSLETLDLSGCGQLRQLPESIGKLSSLHTLDLSGCNKLERLPESIGRLTYLQALDLSGCTQLQELPELGGGSVQPPESVGRPWVHHHRASKLRRLASLQRFDHPWSELSRSYRRRLESGGSLRHLPDSIEIRRSKQLPGLINLKKLNLSGCSHLKQLPKSIGGLSGLQVLNLAGCWQLGKPQLPDSFPQLIRLEALNLSGWRQMRELPEVLCYVCGLKSLYLRGCSLLEELPRGFTQLDMLEVLDISDCSSLWLLPYDLGSLERLHTLDVSDCSQLQYLPGSLRHLDSLETLDLSGCSQLQHLPDSVGRLTGIKMLDLRGCTQLRQQQLQPSIHDSQMTHFLEMLEEQAVSARLPWEEAESHLISSCSHESRFKEVMDKDRCVESCYCLQPYACADKSDCTLLPVVCPHACIISSSRTMFYYCSAGSCSLTGISQSKSGLSDGFNAGLPSFGSR